MDENKIFKLKTIIKTIVGVLIVILITILLSIFMFSDEKDKNYEENKNENEITDDYIRDYDENIGIDTSSQEIENINSLYEDEEDKVVTEEEKKLVKIDDDKTYLFIKTCMENYYVDTQFDIDEIYKGKINSKKEIYSIYYRLQYTSNEAEEDNIFLKIDKKNKTFEVYSNEFIRGKSLLNYKEGKIIDFEGIEKDVIKEDKESGINTYDEDDINSNDEEYVIDLFKRLKFNLILDKKKIYDELDTEYKNKRFKTFEEFKNYIIENEEELKKDKIYKYKKYKRDGYTEFNIVSDKDRHYIFNVKTLMNYSIILDNYFIDTPEYSEVYNNNMPSVHAKYCIDRVRKAINDKNYQYVYDKLNVAQKNNYYKQYNDFAEFLKTEFFKKNKFTIGEYIMIAKNVFQFPVKVSNLESEDENVKNFIMTVFLKDGTDFNISIVKED